MLIIALSCQKNYLSFLTISTPVSDDLFQKSSLCQWSGERRVGKDPTADSENHVRLESCSESQEGAVQNGQAMAMATNIITIEVSTPI